jgi:hypothetical protein
MGGDWIISIGVGWWDKKLKIWGVVYASLLSYACCFPRLEMIAPRRRDVKRDRRLVVTIYWNNDDIVSEMFFISIHFTLKTISERSSKKNILNQYDCYDQLCRMIKACIDKMIEARAIYCEISTTNERCLPETDTEQEQRLTAETRCWEIYE